MADLADATQARTLARQLNERYDSQNYPFRIEEVAGGFMMLTRPQFARWLRRIDGLRPEEYQPQSALETLAIVAYRQLFRGRILKRYGGWAAMTSCDN